MLCHYREEKVVVLFTFISKVLSHAEGTFLTCKAYLKNHFLHLIKKSFFTPDQKIIFHT